MARKRSKPDAFYEKATQQICSKCEKNFFTRLSVLCRSCRKKEDEAKHKADPDFKLNRRMPWPRAYFEPKAASLQSQLQVLKNYRTHFDYY